MNEIGPWTLYYIPITMAYRQVWYGDCGGKTVLENSSRYCCVNNEILKLYQRQHIVQDHSQILLHGLLLY